MGHSSDQRVILITGASSGFGEAFAGLLAEHDYKVFGTIRSLSIEKEW